MKQHQVADHRSESVLAAGGVTTLAALAGVFALAHHGENIMGWYANYVIPAGAILVGLLAASGYGVAAWLTGLKMTRRLMWSVVGQLAVSYLIAQYEEFRLTNGNGLGFWAWFDAITRNFSFRTAGGGPGTPFGVLGYAMRALEVAGFVGGGLLVPLALRAKPYCDGCRTYKRTTTIAWVPGGLPGDGGLDSVDAIFAAAEAGDRNGFQLELAERGPASAKRVTRRLATHVVVQLVRCPRCTGGSLLASCAERHGRNVHVTVLASRSLDGARVRALFDPT